MSNRNRIKREGEKKKWIETVNLAKRIIFIWKLPIGWIPKNADFFRVRWRDHEIPLLGCFLRDIFSFK